MKIRHYLLVVCFMVISGGGYFLGTIAADHFQGLPVEDVKPTNKEDTSEKPELCNNLDDNGNNVVDEGFDFRTDPHNCGVCGNVCEGGHACEGGHCTWKAELNICTPGPCDDPFAHCSKSPEICDGKDNDCNSVIDDGFDLSKDNANCGLCGRDCSTEESCIKGICTSTRKTSTPNEHKEICNYKDDNGDGRADEGINLTSDSANCGICGFVCGDDQFCQNGHCQLIKPAWECTPTDEICNGVDDDCDGRADEDFNLLNDPNHCGKCGQICQAGMTCTNGSCKKE